MTIDQKKRKIKEEKNKITEKLRVIFKITTAKLTKLNAYD